MKNHISAQEIHDLSMQASASDRQRAHLNTHETLDAAVQRLFIATEPGTYIRPHRHSEAHKWEFFVLLIGAIDLLIFDADGIIVERTPMSTATARAVEVRPATWHSYVCSEPGTVALEVKQGPYIPTPDEDFAPWSPAEKSATAPEYLEWMRSAAVGDSPS